jgi:4'-phosphopantetheinyl transferase EntD
VSGFRNPRRRTFLPATLWPLGVRWAAVRLDADWEDESHLLLSNERPMLTGMPPHRARELIAGRALAHGLMHELGVAQQPVLRRNDRSPDWPLGVRGSITHTSRFCAVALALAAGTAALGIDLELWRRLADRSAWPIICRDDELDPSLPDGTASLIAARIFCAKEAFYKAQFPRTGQSLDHHDVRITIGLDADTFLVDCPVLRDSGDAWLLSGIGILGEFEDQCAAAWVVPARMGAPVRHRVALG